MQTETAFLPLGQVFQRMVAAGEIRVDHESAVASAPTPPTSPASTRVDLSKAVIPVITCPRCRGAGWLRRAVELGDPQLGRPVRCDCPAAIAAAQRAAGLEDEQCAMTFSSFVERPGTESALAAAEEWADHPEGWLVLLGPPGTGKSHLLTAIANRLIGHGGQPKYWAGVRLLGYLRAGMTEGAEVSYAARLEDALRRPVLLLDDVGAENDSPFVKERWQEILDLRYLAKLPTVLASNLTRDGIERELGERVASRLKDGRLCRVRGLSAEDYRPLLKREQSPSRLPYQDDGEPF